MSDSRLEVSECGDILVVEDDDAIRRLLGVSLQHHGMRASLARDGVEAIEALQQRRYRVVVLDLMMPRVSGWDVIAWLRDNNDAKPRTVIVVSASNREVMDELDPTVVNAIIFKPFNIDELTGYVTACCRATVAADRRVKRLVGTL